MRQEEKGELAKIRNAAKIFNFIEATNRQTYKKKEKKKTKEDASNVETQDKRNKR